MKPVSITSVMPNVMRWLLAFSMGQGNMTDTKNSFFRKVKYNLVIDRDHLMTIYRYMLHYLAYSGYVRWVRWQWLCLCAIIMLRSFLAPLYWNSWKQDLFYPSKKLFHYGETFNVFWGPIWCKIFRENKVWFLAKRTVAFTLKRALAKREL